MNTPGATPVLPEAVEFGITLTASPTSPHREGVVVRGAYKVPYSEASVPKQATLMPKHIALVVTRADNYMALRPFRDMMVFEDDVKDDGTFASGHFQLNVFDHVPFTEGGDYYILCSLGNYLSNILKVTVE